MGKKDTLRILMIGQKGFPTRKDAGGIERHVQELSRRLVAHGHEVVVFARRRYMSDKEEYIDGVRVVGGWSIPTKHLDSITHSLFMTLRALFMSPDVIHYHGIGPATLAWIPRLFKRRTKVIVTFHSLDRFHGKWGPFARAFLWYAEWAAVVFPNDTIAVSQVIQRYCKSHFDIDVYHIPNGADFMVTDRSDLLENWGLVEGEYILTVARLVRQKGIHHLVKAYAAMDVEKPLVIVGEAAFGNVYADHVKEMSAGNSSIIFTGFQKGEALKQLYANAYIYVHPSEAEGLAISILEAMSAGRCVLVSDIPENMESLGCGGVTFINTDSDDLKEKLQGLINHPEIVEERGDCAKEWVESEYNWDSIVDRTEEVYSPK